MDTSRGTKFRLDVDKSRLKSKNTRMRSGRMRNIDDKMNASHVKRKVKYKQLAHKSSHLETPDDGN